VKEIVEGAMPGTGARLRRWYNLSEQRQNVYRSIATGSVERNHTCPSSLSSPGPSYLCLKPLYRTDDRNSTFRLLDKFSYLQLLSRARCLCSVALKLLWLSV